MGFGLAVPLRGVLSPRGFAPSLGLTSFLIQDLGVALRRGTVSRAFLSYHNHLPAATFFHAIIIPSWSFTSSIRRAT